MKKYPEARKGDTVDKIAGRDVADPYRWMEEIDSAETRKWVEAQAAVAEGYLTKLPRRAEIVKRIKKIWDYDSEGMPAVVNGRVFFSKRTGLQDQPVYFWKPDQDGAKETVLIDANTLSKDGAVALGNSAVSHDGKYFAYSVSEAGSDWEVWKVREVETGRDLDDVIKWVKFSAASWSADNKGFYYSRYDAPPPGAELSHKNENQKVFYHLLRTKQEEDKLVYQRADHPDWGFGAFETEDGKYLAIGVWNGSASEEGFYYRETSAGPKAPFVELFNFEAQYSLVGNDGPIFYFLTTRDAPNKKLVAVDLAKPAPENWKVIIPESKFPLVGASYLSEKFIIQKLVDAHDEVALHDKDGREISKIAMPGVGSVSGFGGRQTDKVTYYQFTNFLKPGTSYRYDVERGTSTLYRDTKVEFDAEKYEARLEMMPSKDGTKIPVFLCHRKGLKLDGSNPTILYGYGGFEVNLGPGFSPSDIVWMDFGGVYVQPSIRGGGEYGKTWHDAGRRANKQNCFDDFISVAEHLIAQKITSPKKLAISGGSNGGLLVAACLNQRPELFGAALPDVGVQDMLRFHKFTIGWAWQDEYGFPDKEEDAKILLKYSPLHNIKSGAKYPATLIQTGDHDDRVFPAHSFKYAATLQAAQSGPAPIILRVDLRAGHGAGKPTSKAIEEVADKYSFLCEALEIKP